MARAKQAATPFGVPINVCLDAAKLQETLMDGDEKTVYLIGTEEVPLYEEVAATADTPAGRKQVGKKTVLTWAKVFKTEG